ncbi:hypothetical protein [Sanguibacter sp. HDW7]|uniref:hypothetical protein n=1 Tax=Sanguibacter sp. HDW7 TaxID=2714931 RepID=UPI00140B9637|nr:hypothetical protein [Sanguibacter sp. HDW7]QIK82783.1 hypothetical protein G7063_03450 [Sanguibacter sp. HDW7]
MTTRPHRRRRGLAMTLLVASLGLAACSLQLNLGKDDQTPTPDPSIGQLGVSFEIGSRNEHHPDGAGPLRIGDPDILRQKYVDGGWDLLSWSTRYRFPVAVTDTEGRTWEVQGLTEDAGALFDGAFRADGPVAVTADVDGPVTLLVPDLTDGDGTSPRKLFVQPLESEMESTLRDRPEHPRLYVDASTFGSIVEQAGGVAWHEIQSAEPGRGGPAEPTVVDVWLMYGKNALSDSEAYDFNATIEAAGFDIPAHLG